MDSNVNFGKQKKRINSATTTQVKSGPSRVYALVILTPAAADTITIIDGDGTTNVTIGVATLTTNLNPFRIELDAHMINGIRITTSGTSDILVIYE